MRILSQWARVKTDLYVLLGGPPKFLTPIFTFQFLVSEPCVISTQRLSSVSFNLKEAQKQMKRNEEAKSDWQILQHLQKVFLKELHKYKMYKKQGKQN